MNNDKIIIKGAKENNLKNIDLELPKNKLIVFTGVSGSGKSTLAFDTIYAEGQRRYMESLSSYARQFLGSYEKSNVESIEGLSPSIAIDQKSTSHNPRSTVGTVTEIYDYLRLLYSRIGAPYCPHHHEPINAISITKIVDIIIKSEIESKIYILSPIVRMEKGTQKQVIDKIIKNGFARMRIDGEIYHIEDEAFSKLNLDKNKKHTIEIVIDRLKNNGDSIRDRLFEDIEIASKWGNGFINVIINEKEKLYSDKFACPICGFTIPNLEPRLFSFNNPLGCCPDCNGLGIKQEVDINLLVPDKNLSINEGCIRYFKNTTNSTNIDWVKFDKLLDFYHISKEVPFKELSSRDIDIILNGSKEDINFEIKTVNGNIQHHRGHLEGIKERIERLYQETGSEFLREYYSSFLRDNECSTCHGSRLNEKALSVYIDGKNIADVCDLTLENFNKFICELKNKLSPHDLHIAELVINELLSRSQFLIDVGLEYLTLSRYAMTLSGGEAQRIRLATQIGSKLSGVLYVLDEPSIGLHQRDSARLIHSLKEMRDLGNTLIVVEHDEETIRSADYIVDIGPYAGIHGGKVIAQGTVEDIENARDSLTGDYLSKRKEIAIPKTRRKGNGKFLELEGASCHNLKNVDLRIPLGEFVCITGVSGSGKSSLIIETLSKAIIKELTGNETYPGKYKNLKGVENIDKIININQEAIGKTPRSNPATYVKAFDDVRDIFASTKEAKIKGFTKSRFSFNVPGGRCEHCQGAGVTRIPMNFLPDVYVKCDECDGKRYNEETLSCLYKGKNIYDCLSMTIEDAYNFFKDSIELSRKLKTLNDVGLGYLEMGQNAVTLSGGEAQRVKLAYYLEKRSTGKTLYILDEPTTGLHVDDVNKLLKVLNRLVDNGDTIVVIEHNLDVIKTADYIIDIGKEGGDKGGEIIAQGTPEEVSKSKVSYTGYYLNELFKNGKIKGV